MIAKSILGASAGAGIGRVGAGGDDRAAGGKGPAVTLVAEGCGPGWWRGPGGHCHPMAMGRACPPGYHLGPEGRRCWPN